MAQQTQKTEEGLKDDQRRSSFGMGMEMVNNCQNNNHQLKIDTMWWGIYRYAINYNET